MHYSQAQSGPREAVTEVSKSKAKGHGGELLLPREFFFFRKGMKKVKLPYSFAEQIRANNFHSLILFFPQGNLLVL